jgi:heparosan-N-sulfate-glucuronate 5-epimerase
MVKAYFFQVRHWWNMLTGNSYWHVPQGLGLTFTPGKLEGYFNDLTRKTLWKGKVDSEGLPLVDTADARNVYFPTVLFHKALGHWDRWLLSGRNDAQHLKSFLTVAEWAVLSQDKAGGWPISALLRMDLASPYSAMTQGQGISILVRAYAARRGPHFLEAAHKSCQLMLRPIARGGTSREIAEGLVLEEFPLLLPDTVLNGWIYALYGLYDLLVAGGEAEVEQQLNLTLEALVALLPCFKCSFWSQYDLAGNLASPFYHRLHIAQLRALERSFPDIFAFSSIRAEFEGQMASWTNEARVVLVKGWQKLRRWPDPLVR